MAEGPKERLPATGRVARSTSRTGTPPLLEADRRPGPKVTARPGIVPSSFLFLQPLDLLPPDYYFG